eukprot:scaffold7099_cov131-Isochrysis_galbana.AAC.2
MSAQKTRFTPLAHPASSGLDAALVPVVPAEREQETGRTVLQRGCTLHAVSSLGGLGLSRRCFRNSSSVRASCVSGMAGCVHVRFLTQSLLPSVAART